MADGEPVTQKQFFQGQEKVIEAVNNVNGNVNELRIDMKEFEVKQEVMEKEVGRLQTWRNGLATVEALISGALVYLGITRE